MQKELKYKVSFATPAFLGNVDQQAQWRTPPFKALIRQWWRVVKARELGYDVTRLRAAENALFGIAADSQQGDSHRSLLQLRLAHWNVPPLQPLGIAGRVAHTEVQRGGPANPNGTGVMVEAALYLGYGPVTTTGNRSFISPDQPNELSIRFPEPEMPAIRDAIQLVAWFGTLGSRSRNGWGSIALAGGDLRALSVSDALLGRVQRDWKACLSEGWPHAIGLDQFRPLIWSTHQAFGDWRAAMKELARIKIAFRTHFKFDGPTRGLHPRHLLSYPITRHNISELGDGNGRIPNQLRFKVCKGAEGYYGMAFHMPCDLPETVKGRVHGATPTLLQSTWGTVHEILNIQMKNLGAAA